MKLLKSVDELYLRTSSDWIDIRGLPTHIDHQTFLGLTSYSTSHHDHQSHPAVVVVYMLSRRKIHTYT